MELWTVTHREMTRMFVNASGALTTSVCELINPQQNVDTQLLMNGG